MNAPDYTPKDGDFVAYLEELERQQMRAHAQAAAADANRGTPAPGRPTSTPLARPHGTGAGTSPGFPTPHDAAGATRPDPAQLVRSLPLGLFLVGGALVLIGLAVNGGGFLVVIGLVMLAYAVRQAMRTIRVWAQPVGATPAQRVTALLKAAAQQKGGAGT